MCIISPPEVEEVSRTKIWIAPVIKDNKLSQLTVYSNTVETNNPVAMILPFPITEPKDFEFVDFSDYTSLFHDLNKLFPTLSRARSMGFATANSFDLDDAEPLPVTQVGNYKASVAFSLADLKRLKFDVFNFTPDVVELMSTYYSKGYGFVVCILDQSKEYHPFGYIHSMREDGRYFVPTRHYHHKDTVDNADWDHEIYVMNCDYSQVEKCVQNGKIVTKMMKFESSGSGNEQLCFRNLGFMKLPKTVQLPQLSNCVKITITEEWGYNHDLVINSNNTKFSVYISPNDRKLPDSDTTSLYVSADGCNFLNTCDLKVATQPYGFRTILTVDGKYLKMNALDNFLHFSGPGCIIEKSGDKYYLVDDMGLRFEKKYEMKPNDQYVELVEVQA